MQIRDSLLENIDENAIRKFLKRRGIERKDLRQNFKYFVSNAVGTNVVLEEFEEFCYDHLVYEKETDSSF